MKKRVLDPVSEPCTCSEESKTCPLVTLVSGLLTAAVLPVVCGTYLVWWQFHKDRGNTKRKAAKSHLPCEEACSQ